jgi:hypothetical protein
VLSLLDMPVNNYLAKKIFSVPEVYMGLLCVSIVEPKRLKLYHSPPETQSIQALKLKLSFGIC